MLEAAFSSYGPLHLLRVRPNAPLSPPGFYAVVKFYSAAQAAAAQQGTDGQTLFQKSPLKVCPITNTSQRLYNYLEKL